MDDKTSAPYDDSSMVPSAGNLFPWRKSTPDFIQKLKDKHVKIELHNRDTLSGTLLKFNPYELLFLEDEGTGPIIVMKNFIACLWADQEDPFEKKPEEQNVKTT